MSSDEINSDQKGLMARLEKIRASYASKTATNPPESLPGDTSNVRSILKPRALQQRNVPQANAVADETRNAKSSANDTENKASANPQNVPRLRPDVLRRNVPQNVSRNVPQNVPQNVSQPRPPSPPAYSDPSWNRKVDDFVEDIRKKATVIEKDASENVDKMITSVPQPLERNDDGSAACIHITKEYRDKVMYVEDCESGVIPMKTNELCKWDMQPFKGVPFGIPVYYDTRTDKIHIIGFTCSVSCALAYLDCNDPNNVKSRELRRLTVQLARDYYGADYSPLLIMPAPPREKLSMLYAKHIKTTDNAHDAMTLALNEFRNGSEEILYHPHPAPPFVRVTQRIDEEITRKENDVKHKQRLDMMSQNPQPIACTTRFMTEQRKYVLSKHAGQTNKRGTIDTLLNIRYKPLVQDDDDDDDDDAHSE